MLLDAIASPDSVLYYVKTIPYLTSRVYISVHARLEGCLSTQELGVRSLVKARIVNTSVSRDSVFIVMLFVVGFGMVGCWFRAIGGGWGVVGCWGRSIGWGGFMVNWCWGIGGCWLMIHRCRGIGWGGFMVNWGRSVSRGGFMVHRCWGIGCCRVGGWGSY